MSARRGTWHLLDGERKALMPTKRIERNTTPFDPGSLYLMDSDRADASLFIDVYKMTPYPLRQSILDGGLDSRAGFAPVVDQLKSGDLLMLQEIEYSNPGDASVWVVLYRDGKMGKLLLRERDRRALRFISSPD